MTTYASVGTAPRQPPADLRRTAGSALCAKMLGEFSYEGMLGPQPDPRPDGEDGYRVDLPGGTGYAFRASRGAFDSWRVDPGSVRRNGSPADDPVRLLLDLRAVLGLAGDTTAEAVQELLATWDADVRLLGGRPTAAALADLGPLALEGHQTGHPCIVLNKGRLGFTAADAARFTPEARQPVRLRWLAADPRLADAHGLRPTDEHLAAELDADVRATFRLRLADALHTPRDRPAPDPDRYVWFPVHPWQFDHVVAPLFAAEITDGSLVALGEAPDRYLPMQSVRTLGNLDRPDRSAVKLPLMIRNTLVWRGLSEADAAAGPHVSAWLEGLRRRDPYLADENRVVLLAEHAAVAVRHPGLAEIPDLPYRYAELLSMMWREPVTRHLKPGEQARTMASLLLVGADGRALLTELIERSGVPPTVWLDRLIAVLLRPLLHFLCRYGVAFTPHGENVVLLTGPDGMPSGIALKDFGADLELLAVDDGRPDPADELPAEVCALLRRWPAGELAHSILSAVGAGYLRFLAPLAETHLGVGEDQLWARVRAEIEAYRDRHPDLADRLDRFGLLAPRVERICLNREQLTGSAFHERSSRDAEFDRRDGTAPNPLAGGQPG